LKRLRAARLVRAILYGTFPEDAPCWGDKHAKWKSFYCREMSWAFKVGEFVKHRTFRYSELLNEARQYVLIHGVAYCTTLEGDLDLLRGWENQLSAKRRSENRYATDLTEEEKLKIQGDMMWKSYVLSGLCPLCGTNLPCAECEIPAMKIDGRGGLIPA
jgi:hypothetical protein